MNYLKGDLECQSRIYNRGMEFINMDVEEFLCLDFETTGLDPDNGAEVIELYWSLVGKDGVLKEEEHHLFFSDDSHKTFHIHNIPAKELESKGRFNLENKEIERFVELVKECYNSKDGKIALMAQFAVFEMSFIEQYLGLSFGKETKLYDTRYAEILLNPDLSHSLGDVAERYGIELEGDLHRAKHDVKLMFGIAQKQFKLL